MTADPRNPQVGDVFVGDSPDDRITITAVGEKRVLAKIEGVDAEFPFNIDNVTKHWKPAPARPTVAEQWGLIDLDGRFDHCHSEDSARERQLHDDTLARIRHKRALIHVGDDHVNWITVAVVCDEHGNPIEVAE